MRIAMFSGPRNISTTMMRSFESRPDTEVRDEPFYGWYLKTSGADHPMRADILASMATDWGDIVAGLEAPTETAAYRFEKHIAFHFAGREDFDWLQGAKIFHLIRDPRAMVASYKNKYDDVRPIIDSYRIQRRLHEQAPAPVVDAGDILKDPAAMLRALCAALEMPFTQTMLSWEAGPRASDGVWAEHWYDAVRASTGFKPFEDRKMALSPELEEVAEACAGDYAYFRERRLTA